MFEKKGGWGCILDYYVYEEGGFEVVEWIFLEGLIVELFVIMLEEWIKILIGYIESLDDFFLY